MKWQFQRKVDVLFLDISVANAFAVGDACGVANGFVNDDLIERSFANAIAA